MNSTLNQSINLHLSTNPETEGFDLEAGKSWIYPTNYPPRDYQFNIIQKALLKNTLVSLPTGLGKTFIAAVVMFNYFRWYPQGKIVFMAPTRPLVKQQVDACFDIMAIPKEATVEITGAGTKISERENTWNEKRVFFITPQILQNDLDKFLTLGLKIKCLVFDEAHRARGNHAYCEVVRKLSATNKYFRVLALSATPGGSIEDVLDIVQNLLISHLEFRTEESLDVSPYVFQRNLTTIVVPLGDKLQEVKDEYMKVLEYYTRTLIRYNVIQGNCANLTKGKIFMLTKSYQQTNKGTGSNYGEIMKCLNICITLYHAAELLTRHGLRSFLTFFDEHIDKPLMKGNIMVRNIMQDVREYLGPAPHIQKLPDGEESEVSKDIKFGHPKFYKLRDILMDHFQSSDASSRVIVFFEYRESVMEAYALLTQSKPFIKAKIFVGQKGGVTQKTQINVVKSFREGTCNVLLSTCIGEEGLDVGEVDLIICFDISNKSPIRMVQRMGRTGRKKDGKIIVLVTEGKEQETLKNCLIHKDNVAFHVLGSKQLANGLQKECPRLLPEGLVPKCEKIFVTVQKPVPKKCSNLKDMLRTLSSKSSEPSFSPNLEIKEIQERIAKPQIFSTSKNAFNEDIPLPKMFSRRIEKQRSFQETYNINHSENTELLVNLLQIAESRRFNIPMSQINKNVQNKKFKQTDIRNMFFKSHSAKDFDLPPTQGSINTESLTITEEKNIGPPELFTEITNFFAIFMDMTIKKCKLCPPSTECKKLPYKNDLTIIFPWVELESSVYTSITLDDLKLFEKSLDKSDNDSFQFDDTLDFQVPDTPIKKNNALQEDLELQDLIDQSILMDLCNKSASFQAPQSLNNLLNKYSTSIIDVEEIFQKTTEISIGKETKKEFLKEEIYQKPTEIILEKENQKIFSEEEIKNILFFFKLKSLNSIFEDHLADSQETMIYSPDMFGNTSGMPSIREKTPVPYDSNSDESSSPILCSFVTKRKKLEMKNFSQNIVERSTLEPGSPSIITISRREFTSTPLSPKVCITVPSTPKTTRDKGNQLKKKIEDLVPGKNEILELEDLFDLESFGIPSNTDEKGASESSNLKIISLSESCCLKDFCEDPLSKISPKTTSNNVVPKNNDNPIDTSGLDEFFDKGLLESLKASCEAVKPNDFTDKMNFKQTRNTESKTSLDLFKCTNTKSKQLSQKDRIVTKDSKKIIDKNNCLHTQLSITQLISVVNKPTQPKQSSQKENLINDNNDSDFVDFSFVKKNISKSNPKTFSSQQNSKNNKFSSKNITSNKTLLSTLNKSISPSSLSEKNKLEQTFYNTSLKTMNEENKNCLSTLSKSMSPNIFHSQTLQDRSLMRAQESSKNTLNRSMSPTTFSQKTKWDSNFQNTSLSTSLGFSKNSLNTSNKSLSPITVSRKNNITESGKNVKVGNTKLNDSSDGSKLNQSSVITISDDSFKTKPKSPFRMKPKPFTIDRSILESHNSDDDFETSITSPIWHRPKAFKKIKINEEKAGVNKPSASCVSKTKCKKRINQFFEEEADVSLCDETNISDDEIETQSQDQYDASFVEDETQNDETQMHAVYLESVRSPLLTDRFKLSKRARNNVDVFSQVENIEDDTYLDDSFVVDNDEIETATQMSQLEMLEMELEMKRKRKKIPYEIKKPLKRKRVICLDSDSD